MLTVLLAALMLAPFMLVVLNAVKSSTDYAAHGPLSLPHSFSLDDVRTFWDAVGFTTVLLNSALISGCVAVFAVVQSAFGTYLLSSVLGAFPREILEAARIDGAGTLRML